MSTLKLERVLADLRQAADHANHAFPVTEWRKISGPGPDSLELQGNGNFSGLLLEPGQDLILHTTLNLPSTADGVPLTGDALELTLFSLYPVDITLNGQSIFADQGVPVASGPALITALPSISYGLNGELEVTIHIPNNQTSLWFNMHFTTPGLRARFELFDLAWAQLSYANDLAATPAEQAAVLNAAQIIPDNLDLFTPVLLKQMEEALSSLAGKAAQHFVHIIGHSHIDMNWLWTMPDTINVIHRDFKSVVAMMEDYPEMTFTHSQPATYEVIRTEAPELFNQVVKLIEQKRWEPATITWVEGDTNMASGEAMARHLLESAIFTRDHLHTTSSTMLEPDTFGHAGNLPQLARSAGAERYYHHRANPGQENRYPAYWWEGQDGSRLLAISTPAYNGDIQARNLVEASMYAKQHGLADSLHFHGIGDHGGGPARQSLDALRRFQQHPLLPQSQCSTLANYTQKILDSGAPLPVQYGESGMIFEGCYTTHADIKYQNRQGENLLSTADTLAVLANQDHSQNLQSAWRTVLFNQFHDIFDGSGIHETYYQSADDFAAVKQRADEATDAALQVLQSGSPAGSIAITNPLGWEREDWVCLPEVRTTSSVVLIGSQGHTTIGQNTAEGLGFVARVPAFGTVHYQMTDSIMEANTNEEFTVRPAFAPNDSRDENWLTDNLAEPPYYKVETPHFRVYLRRDSGILVSFFDKRAQRELVAYGMRRASDYQDSARADLALNVLQLEDEYPHGMSAWHLDEVHSTHSLLRGASTRILESGPARIVFETRHTPRSSVITQHIIFYRDLARVDFETQVDWQELGSAEKGVPNLKVAFTAHLDESQAWFETPFAAVQRPCDGQEVPALRWADVGGEKYGMALMNDSKYGYDILGTRLRLTLLRSGYDPDSISDVGQHTIRYSFLPHCGSWRSANVIRHAAGYNQGLLSRQVSKTAVTLTSQWQPEITGNNNITPSILKAAHDGNGVIIRLYEGHGQSGEVTIRNLPQNAMVWETSITEERIKRILNDQGKITMSFRPWQVCTILIEL